MDTRSRDGLESFPPNKVRDVARNAYEKAKSRLESRRKEKILTSLRKSAAGHKASSRPNDQLRLGAMHAMESLTSISPCSTTMQRVDRAPNSLSWVRVSTNLKTPDNYKDKFFVPYLGESDAQQNFSNSVAADPDQSLTEQHIDDDISDVENTVEVTPVEGPDCSPGRQLRNMKRKAQRNAESRATSSRNGRVRGKKASEIVWDRAARRVALEQMMEQLRFKDIRPVASVIREAFGTRSKGEIESCYKNVMYRRKAYKECDDEALLRHGQRADLLLQLKGTFRTQPGDALRGDSIPFFFCRQCYTYNCLEHGTQTAKPARQPADRTKKDSAPRQAAEDIESRCRDRDVFRCWCVSHSADDAAKWWKQAQRKEVLRDNVKSVVLELFTSLGKDPCRISELGRLFLSDDSDNRLTCHRVGYLLETLEETKVKDNQFPPAARRARKKYRTKAPRGETESMKGGQRVDYAPCQHDGPCTAKSCRCVENGVNCEKYCSCNHNRMYGTRPDKRLPCHHAFQGCTCKSAVACISNACICYSYGRECDPDLCRACYDCRDRNSRRSCRNIGLLMGERQRTVVGRSETHGWGAFAAADIAKGEIIGEYVGEVVSHIDADRRGRLYDEIDYSFLFNITEDWALDSTRLGNKLRYCNHHFKPNCTAKLMRVGGDVRVGLYADRDIGKHEELFFDYKYKNGPAWSMPGSKSGSSRRKQDESAKKRAPAVDNGEEDAEVIPVPKKRARLERRERSFPQQLRDAPRYADMSDADELNRAAREAPHMSTKQPKGTKNNTFQRDVFSVDEDRTALARRASLSKHKDTKIVSGANSKERCDIARPDDMELVFKMKEQNGSVSERPLLCEESSQGSSHGSKLPKGTSRTPFLDPLKASRGRGQQKNSPPAARADNVILVDINDLNVGPSDLQMCRRLLQNGSNQDHDNSHRLSSRKQRTDARSHLQDVFGSDLESLDENANRTGLNPDQAHAARTGNQNMYSRKSDSPPFTSASAPRISSDSSADSMEARHAPQGPALFTAGRRTKDQVSRPAGITKGRSHGRDKSDKRPHARSLINHSGSEIAPVAKKVSGITKFAEPTQEYHMSSEFGKNSSVYPTRDIGARTGAGFPSKLHDSGALQVPSGKASSDIPHINLVSDDEENLNRGSPPGTISNSSSDSSKS